MYIEVYRYIRMCLSQNYWVTIVKTYPSHKPKPYKLL